MMKNYLIFMAVLLCQYFSAQSFDKIGLIEKEAKSHTKKMTTYNINPNTSNYDLQYQRMDLVLDPSVYHVSGSVTSHFKPSQILNSIYFDLSDTLTISKVQYHGIDLAFQQLPTKEVKIDFLSSLAANVIDSLTIHYSGAPSKGYKAFTTGSQDGSPIMFTNNEPYGAQDWFPTKQSMNDKIDRFDFKIITPAQYSVAANGRLISETILSNGEKLTFWRTEYPMAAYLAALSIANFVKINDTIGNPPFPFVNYLYPSTVNDPEKMANIEWTKEAMALFETYLGPYPFRNEKYGHMEYEIMAGMEHQTMSSMGIWSKGIIGHELAHQWFGDKITCGAWNDIWLNEGLTTFATDLIDEKLLLTPDEFLFNLKNLKNFFTSQPDAQGSIYVSDSDLSDPDIILNPTLSYIKAGYVVRMIKWILGDDVFYPALRDYLSTANLVYNYAKTSDFKESLLQSTGKDFTEFFNDWIYGKGYPTYNVKWSQSSNNTLTFKVSQTQSDPSVSFFKLPLPIKVTGIGGEVAYFALNNTSNNQYFTESVSFPVASVQFNYETQILDRNSTVSQNNTLSTEDLTIDQFSLYPNPARNELYVKGINKPTAYSIHFVDGKLVKKDVCQPNKPINISELAPGTYIFTIKEKNIKFLKN